MFGKRKNKEQDQNIDMWGEPTTEQSNEVRRPKSLDKMEAKIDALPAEQRNKRYLTLAIVVMVFCLAGFILAAVATCSGNNEDMSREDAINTVLQSSSSSSSSSTEAIDPTTYFANLSALSNLSDESKQKFATEFRAYVTQQGNNEFERVMCYSRIDAVGNITTFWVSCPSGKQYYKVDFNVDTKEFSFTPCELPENLPEVNYAAIEAQKQAAANGTNTPSSAVEGTSANDVSDNTNQTVMAKVTSTGDLSTIWSNEAVAALPAAIDGFATSKGRTIDLARSVVDLPTARTDNGMVTATLHCTDSNGDLFDVEASWDQTQKAFGMKLL